MTCQLCAWCACFDLIWMPHLDTCRCMTTAIDDSTKDPDGHHFFVLKERTEKLGEIELILFLKFIFLFSGCVMFDLNGKKLMLLLRSAALKWWLYGAVLSVFFTIFCYLSKPIRAGRVLDVDIHAHTASRTSCRNAWNLFVDGNRQFSMSQSKFVLLWCHFDCQRHNHTQPLDRALWWWSLLTVFYCLTVLLSELGNCCCFLFPILVTSKKPSIAAPVTKIGSHTFSTFIFFVEEALSLFFV